MYQLSLFPFSSINAYLADGVLIDAGVRWNRKQIMRLLEGFEVNAHALTHAHGDHQGSSQFICEQLKIPFWVGQADAEVQHPAKLWIPIADPGTGSHDFRINFGSDPDIRLIVNYRKEIELIVSKLSKHQVTARVIFRSGDKMIAP